MDARAFPELNHQPWVWGEGGEKETPEVSPRLRPAHLEEWWLPLVSLEVLLTSSTPQVLTVDSLKSEKEGLAELHQSPPFAEEAPTALRLWD